LLAAPRTGRLGLDFGEALGLAGQRNCAEHRNPFRLAGFTTLGFVLELLVVEEELFSGGKNKIASTINTLEHLVLKFH
jgi:hypothetical protein